MLNYIFTDSGKAVIKQLAVSDIEVIPPSDQHCWGIPVIMSGGIETIRKIARLFLGQRDDKNRFPNSSQDFFGDTSKKGLTDNTFPMSSHHDDIAVKLIGFFDDLLRRVPFADLYRFYSIGDFRIIGSFAVDKSIQMILNLFADARPLFL
jgi:hypothetical protein